MGNIYAQQAQVFNHLVGGSGLSLTKYPLNAAGVTLTGGNGGAYTFKAAGANVASIVAINTIGTRWRLVAFALNTFSATSIFVIRLGALATAGAVMARVIGEFIVTEITASAVMGNITIPYGATIQPDGVNDGVAGDAASSGGADTVVCSVTVATGLGVS